MPETSPYLNGLLAQWSERMEDLHKDITFQRECLQPMALAVEGSRLALRDRRRQDLRELDQPIQEAGLRWEERLRRIEEWKSSVSGLQEEQERLQALLSASLWLQKAREYQDTFIQRIDRGSSRLEVTYQVIHYKLEAWLAVLQERERSLFELLSKAENAQGPFYVSRARKQPELDFLTEQTGVQTSLGEELQSTRRLLTHLRNRVRKALNLVEERASGAEIFYEIHKQEIISSLKGAEGVLETRRKEILSEALMYESGRHLLKKLQGIIQGLGCIEDIPQRKLGLFSRKL